MVVQLVLDVNGVLVKRKWTRSSKTSDVNVHVLPLHNKGFQHVKIRPFAIQLLRCIDVIPGVMLIFWSSMTGEYMQPIVDMLTTLAGITKFTVMTQADCTVSNHPYSTHKPLFSKDVARIFERYPNSDGTIFIDDSMIKMGYNEDEVIRIVPEWDGIDYDDTVLRELSGELTELVERAK